MKITINHPDGPRNWPEDYLPIPHGEHEYIPPLCPTIDLGDGEETANTRPWLVDSKGRVLTQPEDDPVRLVVADLPYYHLDLSTLRGMQEYTALIAAICTYDVRGYIQPQLGSITHTIKTSADSIDYGEFIERLEAMERDFENISERVYDEDLSASRARQPDGFIQIDHKAAEKAYRKLLEGKK